MNANWLIKHFVIHSIILISLMNRWCYWLVSFMSLV